MNLLAPAPGYAPAGLNSLLVGPWVAGADYVYASAQRDILTDLDPAAIWWPVDCQQVPGVCEFSQVFGTDKNGPGYQQSITAALPGLLVAFRAGLLNFSGLPLLALCQDMRGQWWLFGQDGTLRLPAYTQKSGPAGGESLSSFTLAGRQLAPACQVDFDGTVTIVDYGFNPNQGGSGDPHTLPFTLA